jgi:hypothetical protein
MATWTEFDPTDFLPKKPIIAAQGIGLAANPTALAEGAIDAPVNQAAWHPYNMVKVNDGNTGLIWDAAVNGPSSNIVTPDFQDGYEYQILLSMLARPTAGTTDLRLEVFQEAAAAYTTPFVIGNASLGGTSRASGVIEFDHPRRLARRWAALSRLVMVSGSPELVLAGSQFSTAQRILRARLTPGGGDFATEGQVFLYRRRDFTIPI